MPIYLFWGEDEFAIAKSVEKLKKSVLDPNWLQFNYHKLPGAQNDATIEALNQAMTPVFGMGGRLVWLADTTICQHCSEDIFSELNSTLPVIPKNSHLLLTSSKKPDKRLKSTKILQQYGEIKEFSWIPPWKTAEILKKVQQLSQEFPVKLTSAAVELLAESVGNNTRQLWSELQKLSIYGEGMSKPLDVETISTLVHANTQNSLQLAAAIRQGDQDRALGLVVDLINKNEPALRIVATLVGQFRTWTIVRLMVESGEKDEGAIAKAAEVNNPKRIYFLRKEIQSLSLKQLLSTLPILLELEVSLKRGADPFSTLQTKIIELCHLCHSRNL
ncbi:MAG: DNA polymerase III subunit delta [Moorea sp. SIO2B7]|nr:DNA polymerase III subunit delta [Moorena sp. SIO2B7]